VDNLPTLRSSQEADTREPKEKDDESIPDVEEPLDPIDPPPHEPSSSRKRPSWLRGLLDDAEGHAAPRGTFCESKKPNRYQGYLTIMSTIMQNEPSSFSDVVKHQVWKDVMTIEYESIMENDVWEVVPRPQDKTIVTSKCLYKIKHAADGSLENYKARFFARGFSQKEGIDYDICTCCQIYDHLLDHSPYGFTRMEPTSDGCQDHILSWFNQRRGLCGETQRI